MSLAIQEREKYERVWAHKDYHSHSPGERLAKVFLKQVPWDKGDTLIDLGCGTARASREFVKAGLQVYLLDHVNAVDPSIHLPFIEANLWDMPILTPFDWFYCCDVMEHIPPEKIDAVLDNVWAIGKRGGFFQIAMFEDNRWGEVLHLTIESSGWWAAKLAARWNKIATTVIEKGRMVAVVER